MSFYNDRNRISRYPISARSRIAGVGHFLFGGLGLACIASLLTLLSVESSMGKEVYASLLFPPADGDPQLALNGVIKIDLETGAVTPFIFLGTANLFYPSDVQVGPDNNLYVSSLAGFILKFDAQTGAPLPSTIPSEFGGFPGLFAGTDGGANAIGFGPDGYLYTATAGTEAGGGIAMYDPATGAPLGNAITGLASPDVVAFDANGALVYDSGEYRSPGYVARLSGGETTTLIPTGTAGFDNASSVLFTPSGETPGRMLVSDFIGNQIISVAMDGSDIQPFATIPPAIPDPLPPGVDPRDASNFPSEMLLTGSNTVIVSTFGLTQRPDNRGSLLEYDLQGNLLRTIVSNIPPISGIAFAYALGDLNQDDSVDAADAAMMFEHWGQPGQGDLNRDGTIDAADAGILFAHWTGDTGPAQAVPEPQSLVLGLSLACFALRRRTKVMSAA